MNKATSKRIWVAPRLDKIEMLDTQGRILACESNQSDPQSKMMSSPETAPGCGAAS
jgi:hypothetical protein